MKLDTKQKKILTELAEKYGVTLEEAVEIVESPFFFMRETISKIRLDGDETEEEFHEKTKNFNIPRIGKLFANINTFNRYRKKWKKY